MNFSVERRVRMVVVCALDLVFEVLGVTFVHNPLVRVRDNVRRHTFLRMSYVCFARIFYHRRGAIVNDNFALLALFMFAKDSLVVRGASLRVRS